MIQISGLHMLRQIIFYILLYLTITAQLGQKSEDICPAPEMTVNLAISDDTIYAFYDITTQ